MNEADAKNELENAEAIYNLVVRDINAGTNLKPVSDIFLAILKSFNQIFNSEELKKYAIENEPRLTLRAYSSIKNAYTELFNKKTIQEQIIANVPEMMKKEVRVMILKIFSPVQSAFNRASNLIDEFEGFKKTGILERYVTGAPNRQIMGNLLFIFNEQYAQFKLIMETPEFEKSREENRELLNQTRNVIKELAYNINELKGLGLEPYGIHDWNTFKKNEAELMEILASA